MLSNVDVIGMNSALRGEGQFTANGFDYLVMMRIYEVEEGGRFSVQVKPVFRGNQFTQSKDRGKSRMDARNELKFRRRKARVLGFC